MLSQNWIYDLTQEFTVSEKNQLKHILPHVHQCIDSDGFRLDEILGPGVFDDKEFNLSASDMTIMGLFCLPYPHTYIETVIRSQVGMMSGKVLPDVYDIPIAICVWEIDVNSFRFQIFNKLPLSATMGLPSHSNQWRGKKYVGTATYNPRTNDYGISVDIYDSSINETNAEMFCLKSWLIVEKVIVLLATEGIDVVKESPPIALNKKRAKNGKKPFRDYHVLKATQELEREHRDLGGTHASPRIHFRRGHIREYEDGRKTWIRSTIVNIKRGDNEWVNKEYKL
jgi:hypothetical protein